MLPTTRMSPLELEAERASARARRAVGARSGARPRPARREERVGEDPWDEVPAGWYARRGKRALDLALLALALPLALVPALLVALANAVLFRDPRKVFFRQERLGLRGRRFSIVKFRTMREASGGAMDSWSNGHDQARVTRFGRFLRNTHLDELPQLYNVLRGDMQLIGPRPEMTEVDAWAREHVPGFERRLALRPGITGLAQIVQGYTGRDPGAYRRKLALDALYIRRVSPALDAWILARTCVWVLRRRGWKSWQARASRRAGEAAVALRASSRQA